MPRIVAVKLPDDVYRELEKRAREEGFVLVSDYVREVIMRELGRSEVSVRGIEERLSRIEEGVLPTKLYERIVEIVRSAFTELVQGGGEGGGGIDEERIMSRLERRVQDLVNPFTAKVDSLAGRVAELFERIENLEERISRIEDELKKVKEHAERGYVRHRRSSAIERLKRDGVVFESELTWLRSKAAFFERLRREGAKVIEAAGERIAVDPGFWREFVDKLASISTSSDEEIRDKLSEKEYKLFVKLREDGLVYYDSSKKAWRLIREV